MTPVAPAVGERARQFTLHPRGVNCPASTAARIPDWPKVRRWAAQRSCQGLYTGRAEGEAPQLRRSEGLERNSAETTRNE